jgi:nucleoside-diphosphate kinase
MSVIAFEVETFDPVSKLIQNMYLKFFLDNNTIELLQGTKFFLARIFYPEITLNDLFIGNSVTIFTRRYTIKAYANTATTSFMKAREVHYLSVVNSSAIRLLGALITAGTELELRIANVKTSGSDFYADDIQVLSGDTLIEMVGITTAKTDGFLERASSLSPSARIFSKRIDPSMTNDIFLKCSPIQIPSSCSLCIVKPHILQPNGFSGTYSFKLDGKMIWENKEKQVSQCGALVTSILDAGFSIQAAMSIHLSQSMTEQFWEVYRNVFSNWTTMIDHLSSGPILALMITPSKAAEDTAFGDIDVVTEFRTLCGPIEPELARALRPTSLRALYGKDFVRNGVHCSDLPEDGELECRHFFELLAAV